MVNSFFYFFYSSSFNVFNQVRKSIEHAIFSAVFGKGAASDRDYRIVGSDKIEMKLKKQWECAQNQKIQEKDKQFVYEKCKGDLEKACGAEFKIGSYTVGEYHAQGRRPTMEDQSLAKVFTFSIGEKQYNAELFGVFDGHGGAGASLYMKEKLEKKLEQNLKKMNSEALSNAGIWNALKLSFVEISQEYKKTGGLDGTTATVVLMLDGKVWTANVGDSRAILENEESGTFQLSEDAKPDDERYKKGIEKRGGQVLNVYGVPRINGNLAVGRAIGDASVGKGINSRPKITMIPLSKICPGSHMCLACDGIYDVASTGEIGGVFRFHGQTTSAKDLARNIVYSAFKSGSTDNLSAMVIKFPAQKIKRRSVSFWDFFCLSRK